MIGKLFRWSSTASRRMAPTHIFSVRHVPATAAIFQYTNCGWRKSPLEAMTWRQCCRIELRSFENFTMSYTIKPLLGGDGA
jgi:hypothetical protein